MPRVTCPRCGASGVVVRVGEGHRKNQGEEFAQCQEMQERLKAGETGIPLGECSVFDKAVKLAIANQRR